MVRIVIEPGDVSNQLAQPSPNHDRMAYGDISNCGGVSSIQLSEKRPMNSYGRFQSLRATVLRPGRSASSPAYDRINHIKISNCSGFSSIQL